MSTVSLEEARQNVTDILARAQAGESFIVLQADRPIVEIRPVAGHRNAPRPFGLCAGQFTVPDSFDEPLPDHVIESFED